MTQKILTFYSVHILILFLIFLYREIPHGLNEMAAVSLVQLNGIQLHQQLVLARNMAVLLLKIGVVLVQMRKQLIPPLEVPQHLVLIGEVLAFHHHLQIVRNGLVVHGAMKKMVELIRLMVQILHILV